MQLFRALVIIILIFAAGEVAAQPTIPLAGEDSIALADTTSEILVDATYVPCSDSTESLLVMKDGRVAYALHDRGIVFPMFGAMLTDLQAVIEPLRSSVDRSKLDSCTTIGVILAGPRYILLNNAHPQRDLKDLQIRLERVRKYARKRLESVNRLSEKAAVEPDTTIESGPTVDIEQLRQWIAQSPVAQQWKCRGHVMVSAKVHPDGRVRQAFVENANVRGKCAPLLTTTALRAVLLSKFQPARKKNKRPVAGWIDVEVAFKREE